MRSRRIVTGRNAEGKSVIVSDGLPPRTHVFEHVPGHEVSAVWATGAGQPHPAGDGDPTPDLSLLMPDRPDSTVMQMVQLPPDAVMGSLEDPEAAMAELAETSPGLYEHFEPDAPGFHTTQTTDYVILIEGTLVLELDDGVQTTLEAGDVVVQNETRHAWRNPTDTPATFICVIVGRPTSSA
jgi:mannose-6-phosphate isomerase-like protein (cupin superfamily)